MNLPIQKRALIQTERLTIRPYSKQDVVSLAELLENQSIAETFMVPEFETRAQALALAERLVSFSQISDTTHLEYGIYRMQTLIGFVNDCGVEGDAIEIGYVIHPQYQGQGYATEAVRAVIAELRTMGFRTVRAGFFAENTASRRVLEKCGMTASGLAEPEEYRGKLHTCIYYQVLFS